MSVVLIGCLASLAAGLMTAVGALPVLFDIRVSQRGNDTMLGFAAGVMLAASFFSLLLPSIEAAESLYRNTFVAAAIASVGLCFGTATMAGVNEWVPHTHFVSGAEGRRGARVARIWLFVLAITIHNVPEGLAVGVGFGSGDIASGLTLAAGIGLQNAPEGLAVALALNSLDYSRLQSFLVAGLTGLVEPLGGLFGAAVVTVSEPLLPWGLAFAAGAMVYVISHEIIPETHRHGHQDRATAGLTVGLAVMMFLDVALG